MSFNKYGITFQKLWVGNDIARENLNFLLIRLRSGKIPKKAKIKEQNELEDFDYHRYGVIGSCCGCCSWF
jgi:hypothetical protein